VNNDDEQTSTNIHALRGTRTHGLSVQAIMPTPQTARPLGPANGGGDGDDNNLVHGNEQHRHTNRAGHQSDDKRPAPAQDPNPVNTLINFSKHTLPTRQRPRLHTDISA
jgi:hypothetical protein